MQNFSHSIVVLKMCDFAFFCGQIAFKIVTTVNRNDLKKKKKLLPKRFILKIPVKTGILSKVPVMMLKNYVI